MKNSVVLPSDFNGLRVHFVGIKGTGMVALVEILKARGAVITGSDVSERFYTDEILDKLGISAMPFGEQNVTSEINLVVYSSAYSPDKNPDLAQAVKLNIPMMLYSDALGAISSTAFSAGICGVHGKTTTTGITGTLLRELDLSSQVLAGSIISSFGNSCTMTKLIDERKNFFVAETCEYQRHFMAFDPKMIILTSVESDHQDYYPTFADIQNAFVDYICKLPENGTLIYCADDKGAVETAEIARSKRPDIKYIPYGEKAGGDYRISFGKVEGGRQYFTLSGIGEFCLCVPGTHNVRNSAAAIALCIELLKEDSKNPCDYYEALARGLEKFSGGKRRSEIIARKNNSFGDEIVFLDDYGHHPTAIRTTLKGYRDFYRNHMIVVDFMSHTYTRTQALLEEFASSFEYADVVIFNKIYGSAREDASAANVTGKTLYDRALEYAKTYGNIVIYAEEFDEASKVGLEILSKKCDSRFGDGYLFVTMGAGDNWKVGKKIIDSI